MAAKLYLPTDQMDVSSLVVLIYGPPGSWKTSIAQTAAEPFTMDYDKGLHRTKFRKVGMQFDVLQDIEDAYKEPKFQSAKTIVVDTIGGYLALQSADIIAGNSKMGSRSGGLSLQGYGALKNRFLQWLNHLRLLNKDVVMIAHEKEEKDGDNRIVRPDITGGSYAEVMKPADLVGLLKISGGKRVLDFNPSDSSIGKNAAGWNALTVPELNTKPTFLADLLADAKARIGQVSAESAELAMAIDGWRQAIEGYHGPEQFTEAMHRLSELAPVARAQVKVILWDRAKTLGLTFDKASKEFVGKEEVVANA